MNAGSFSRKMGGMNAGLSPVLRVNAGLSLRTRGGVNAGLSPVLRTPASWINCPRATSSKALAKSSLGLAFLLGLAVAPSSLSSDEESGIT